MRANTTPTHFDELISLFIWQLFNKMQSGIWLVAGPGPVYLPAQPCRRAATTQSNSAWKGLDETDYFSSSGTVYGILVSDKFSFVSHSYPVC
ncbi:hypothetical protein J6590_033748 [Homalodisca vitripennis]|nr:hypothetical protein J6590_033748 [Homalodisca vitripennis]